MAHWTVVRDRAVALLRSEGIDALACSQEMWFAANEMARRQLLEESKGDHRVPVS